MRRREPTPSSRCSSPYVLRTTRPGARARSVDLLDCLEPAGEDRDRFGAALAAFLSGVDATNLVGVAGIPGQRGFFNEFSDRLAGHLLPAPRDGRDLRELAHRLYPTRQETERLREMPQELFHRVVAALAAAPPAGAWDGLRGAFADGFRLLLTRVESEGLSPKLRSRATACPVSASPFHRAGAAGDALLAAWLADADTHRAGRRLPHGADRVPARSSASSSSTSTAAASASTSSSRWR